MGEILLAPMDIDDIDDIDESFYNIVIEIDENIASYLKTLSPGCLLSVSELLSLATKLSCDTCSATFYSQTLLQGHLDTHHRDDDSGSVEEEIEPSVECYENELVDVKVEVEEEDQGDSINKSETLRNSSCPSKESTPLRILDKSKSKYEDTESKALLSQTGIGTELQENKIKRCYVKIVKISNRSFEGFDDLVSSLSNSNISEKSSPNKRRAKQFEDLDQNNEMSEYEKIREENIKARENMLAALMVDFQNYKKDFGIQRKDRQYIQSEETRRRKRQRKRDLKYHSIRSRPRVGQQQQLERREKSSRIADQSIWAYTHPEDSSEIEEVWNEDRRGKYCQRVAGEAGNEEEDAIVITDDEDEEGAGAEGAERALVAMLRGALDPGDTGLVPAAELSSFLRVTSRDQQRVVDTCRGEGGMVDYRRLVRQLLHN